MEEFSPLLELNVFEVIRVLKSVGKGVIRGPTNCICKIVFGVTV
jgi:hypothetical protein